jgi:hypothetical protein
VVARRRGGGLVAFVRRRKKARVARWATWAGGLAAWAGRRSRLGGGVVAGPADMGRAEVADFLRSTHS